MYTNLSASLYHVPIAEVKTLMRADKNSIEKTFLRAFAPLWMFAALVIVYALSLSALRASETAAIAASLLPFAVCMGFCVFLVAKGKIQKEHVTAAILLLGIALRVWYITATPWNERQHDVFVFETQGHAGYIYTLMKTGRLPETNTGLFYHPPLHPFIMSVAGNFLSRFINTTEQVFETLQLLPAYYSLMCGWVFLKILDLLRIRQGTKLLFFAFFTLHPSLIIFSGSINNDILCLLLSICTVLYLLRFYESQSMKNAFCMALCLGLAMMTKLSAVTIAPVIAVVFIIRLVRPTEGRIRRSVMINELCFGALSIPLGMWYPIRNLIKFDQPFGYVMPIGTSHPLYCGDRSFFERFISLPLKQLFENPYCMPEEDFNIPMYTVKCSVFGEYTFDFPKWAVSVLLVINCAVIVFCVFAAVYTVIKKKDHAAVLTAVSAVSVAFFVWFNIRYPNGCSMDFRYISVCLAGSLAVSSVCFDMLSEGLTRQKKLVASIPFVLFAAIASCIYLSEKLVVI